MDPLKDIIRKHWDGRAARFDEGASHGLLNAAQAAAWRALFIRIAGTLPLDVLDVGCGTGTLAMLLADCGHRVTGLDFSPAMLELARAKAAALQIAVTFIEADAEQPPLRRESVDLIMERHVLWTLPHPATALEAWRRLLKPGGRIVLIEGHWGTGNRNDAYVGIEDQLPLYGGRSGEEVAALARKSGFASVVVESLMDTELWTKPPEHPRYLITCR